MTSIEIQRFGAESAPKVRQLWEVLFDHHVSIGAAGLPTIARHESWPRRQKYYEDLFEQHANTGLWIASLDGEPLGYAVAYEDKLDGERAMILETLSVSANARGHGIGTRLMGIVDSTARLAGIDVGVVDVMGENPRARELYLRQGYAPYSEAWMRSTSISASIPRPTSPSTPLPCSMHASASVEQLAVVADQLGLQLSSYPGPDDTWESSNRIAELSKFASVASQTSPIAVTASGYSVDQDEKLRQLAALFSSLVEAGLWTIRFEIPCAPEAPELRTFLQEQGFRLSTERLVRTL